MINRIWGTGRNARRLQPARLELFLAAPPSSLYCQRREKGHASVPHCLTRHAPPLPRPCSAVPPRRPSICCVAVAVASRLRDGPAGPARRSPTRSPPACGVGPRGCAAAARSSGCSRQHHELGDFLCLNTRSRDFIHIPHRDEEFKFNRPYNSAIKPDFVL